MSETVRARLVNLGLMLLAPVLALLVAYGVTTLILVLAGDPAGAVWAQILSWPEQRNLINIVNSASVYYLSGLAVAIGFRMNLFNIGVDGQYRIAAFVAAVIAGEAWLPGYLNTALAVVAAMLVGAAWAGIAGLLRVTRGVSEVISTIMLNAISTALVAYLLRKWALRVEGSNDIGTKPIPEGSRVPGFTIDGVVTEIYGFVVLAVIMGILYSVIINRTRFGFDLRATGHSETAAVASGVSVKKMIMISMLLSGAVAGLVGLPILFGDAYSYGATFQSGLGFAGIAIALLGRNNAIGIVLGALLFAFLDEQSNPLQIVVDVSPQIVEITQGVIVLAVVIAYEVVARIRTRLEQRHAGRDRGPGSDADETPPDGPSGTPGRDREVSV
jgi:simple sugar transport system permease protein